MKAERATGPELSTKLYVISILGLALSALALRLWGIKSGLPFVYNLDEGAHFAPKAVGFFSGDFNPHYFLNPPAFSYLLYLVYAVFYGGRDAVQHAFAVNQTEVFAVARAVSAALGVAAVCLVTLLASRLYDRRVGLVAGGLMAVAFLPVYYGHLALNDGPALVPLLLSLYGSAGILLRDRGRDWIIAGVGLGIAIATKYTAGIAVLPLATAALFRLIESPTEWTKIAKGALAAAFFAALAFFVFNPYSLFDFKNFKTDLLTQRTAAEDFGKLGQKETSGIRYYLWTLTWGLGWIPALAALGGGFAAFKNNLRKALFLVPYPVVFLLYMGLQDRFFGRWLMPALPALVILAALLVVRVSDLFYRPSAPGRYRLALGAMVVVLLAQPVIYVVHNDRVLARPDTRNLAREWMVRNIPAGSKIVLEPIVPHFIHDPGRPNRATPSGDRWVRYTTANSTIGKSGRKLPGGKSRKIKVEDYPLILRPALLKDYKGKGYCWVITGSTQYGRAEVEPQRVPDAIAYYRELKRTGQVVYQVSPFRRGKEPVGFNFDWSFNYYPLAYRNPGPEIVIYNLPNNRCK